MTIKFKKQNEKQKETCIKGIILKVGDIIKFGWVPFVVKESSIEEGVRGEDFIMKEENETMERNGTDVESLDYNNIL